MKRPFKWLLPLGVALVGATAALWLILTRERIEAKPPEVLPPLVRVTPVVMTNVMLRVQSQGTVLPQSDVHLSAEVAGRVVAISPSLAAGGFFDEGDVLVSLDPRDYELAVVRAQAQVAEAEARLAREEAEAQIAREEWQELGGTGAPPPLVVREPQLAEARATLASAQAVLEQARLDLEKTKLRAPFAGRVWAKHVDVGQFVNRGTVVARLYGIDYAEVRLPLPPDELAYLDLPLDFRGEPRTGTGPRVALRASLGGQAAQWTGRLVRTEGEIDPRSRMITAVARVENPYGRHGPSPQPPLAVGMFVEAEIEGRHASNVVVLPRVALRLNEQVLVVDAEDRLRFRPVGLLRTEREHVVVQSGLQAGERVCISPMETPVDGMRVRVAESEGAPAVAQWP